MSKKINNDDEANDLAKRNPISARFDLIPGDVLEKIAEGFGFGAKKYGDYNWQQSRLTGVDGPVNHALKHINLYNAQIKDDESDDLNIHLRNAIMNLIFEYWYNLHDIRSANLQDAIELTKRFGLDVTPEQAKELLEAAINLFV